MTVRGTVLTEDRQSIPGAGIIVQGTSTGTVTDREGKFTIRVPENRKLEVSFVGYEPQVIANLVDPVIILKESATEMDEVVVMGYGSQISQRNVMGAVAVIRPEEIRDLSFGDLSSSLRGLVPGLEVVSQGNRPGDTATIIIRNADMNYLDSNYKSAEAIEQITTPLYVIDDYITTEEEFNNLNPNEIESLTILKDAAAAVYGVNGGRGVILVTTRRGQPGPARISYQGQFGFKDAIKHPKMLDAYSYGQLWNAVVRAADRSSTDVDYIDQMFSAAELELMKSMNYDLLDKYWTPALTHRHSMSLSGGSENANYFTNISYYSEDGNIGRLDYNRWNFRSGVDARLGNWFKASVNISGQYGQQESSYSTMVSGSAGVVNSETDYRILLMNPRYIPDYVNGLSIVRNGIDNTQNTNALQNYNFDVIQKSENYQRTTPTNLNMNFSLTHDFGWTGFLKGLTIRVSYSRQINVNKVNRSIGDFTVYRMINRVDGMGNSTPQGHLYTGPGADYDMTNFEEMKLSSGGGEAGGDRGFISRTLARDEGYQVSWVTNYARQFGLHGVSAMFTIEKSEKESEDLYGRRNQPYSFSNGQYHTAYGSSETDFGRSESGNLSYVGRAGYSYDGKYLLDFVVRINASTKFHPDNYWGVFPSISAGWIASDEPWFHSRVIDFLKFRGSFGLMGSDNIAAWAWLTAYGVSNGGGSPLFGTNPNAETNQTIKINYPSSGAANPQAHWDKSYKTNFGVDLRFLRNRLSVGLDAFYNMNRDQFMVFRGSEGYAATVGAQAGAENYGSTDNYGIELSLG
ncbi:MAG: SusC/RagA family TonB-linked outer membrane protein [Rikenellaceae bacterium]|nr:SusC/RagA family TonB-linked outer membrane protein [Rikenellaceae bacterium]